MKRKLRIVFMGTPDFAVETLKSILEAGHEVVGVITAPDRPAGRGRKLQMPAVKKFALSKDLNVLQPTNLKDPEFLETLRSLQANLQVVVAFRMLPEAVWAMPEYGTFNLHASLLPEYRGAAPINWALINGETQTGVTTFFIDEKIDTGAVILQETTNITPQMNAGELHDHLMKIGAELVIKTLNLITSGAVSTQLQPKGDQEKKAYKLNKENCKINWETSAETIHNLVRGLSPYPGAWCHFEQDGKSAPVKIYAAALTEKPATAPAGSLKVENKQLLAATKDQWLEVLELQLPGKKRMAVKDLLNGMQLNEGAMFS
ncbi:methionyl-tRNA formyltransferase [Robertkochia marina]|uniref:Methionyl-tRNA formyltransferase n=1 Tax=Robertkochia marina TaxID=1227945 RepID=A0A4S3LYI4_9FLAO|nr:methionyl-tRNA formyltransferase [Robertkochia marina]THD66649.1 methionyl-tRNA formyltransferase [Robertkochia marina]TRZ45512.1 methionyl-tRNA formyltransferase [Robertkochia marina]